MKSLNSILEYNLISIFNFNSFYMDRFTGQVAIITGSTEGIGLSTACHLAEEGASVVINGRDINKLNEAYSKISNISDAEVMIFQGDINKKSIRNNIVLDTIKRFDRIDILINNAGGGTDIQSSEEISDEEWNQTIEFNLNSSFKMSRNVIPYMRANNYGRIVNISSVAGRFRGRLSGAHYSAAKAGLLGMTRHLSWELASFNITVNAVAPGFVATDRAIRKWEHHTLEDKALIIQQIPLKRFALPEEIATAICFLASKSSSYITGATLDVNGGFYMS